MKFKIFILFLIVQFCAFSQAPVNIHLTEKEGLLDNEIYSIAEDNNGVIWLAGNKGLTRFNGTDFTIISHPKKRGLSVFDVQIDDKNRIWVVNISGQIFYVENNIMHLFDDLKDTLKGQLANIAVSNNTLVVSTDIANVFYDLKKNKKKIIPTNFLDGDVSISPKVINNKVIFSSKNLVVINGVNQTVLNSLSKLKQLQKPYKRLSAGRLINLTNNHFLLHTATQDLKHLFYKLNSDFKIEEIASPKELSKKIIIKIKFIDNIIWITTRKGVFRFALKNNKLVYIDTILKNQIITDVIKDNDENYWLTTLENHVFVLPNLGITKINMDPNFGKPKRMIQTEKNELLIGFSTGEVIRYNSKNKNIIDLKIPFNRAVSALGYNKFNNSYVATLETVSYEYLKFQKNKKWIKLPNLTNVKEIYFTANKTALISTSFVSAIGNYKNIEYDFNWKNATRGYTNYYNSKTKESYFAKVDQLIVVDSLYRSKEIKNLEKQSILVKDFAKNSEILWASSLQNGIYKIKQNKVVQQLSTKNGLLSNLVNAITADGVFLWIATDKGIQQYNSENKTFKNLFINDGVPNYNIKDIEVINNEVYFCSANQVFAINKKTAFKTFNNTPVYVKELQINNKDVALKKTYNLLVDKSKLQLTFRANGLRAMSSGDYFYTLNNKDWIKIPKGSSILQFPQLPIANNILIIKGLDSNGKETFSNPIYLNVKQPFYKRLWFILSFIILFSSVISMYYKRKIKQREIEKNQELKQLALDNELINLRLENLRSQMNPHFIFNALNSIQEHIVGNKTDVASDYLVKFAKLIRMYLDHSRVSVVTLHEENNALELYLELEKLRFGNKLNYQVSIDVKNSLDNLTVPPLLIQPYVENAIKHGLLNRKTDRELYITMFQKKLNAPLKIIIKDNGIGRKASAEKKRKLGSLHKSFATGANEQRVDLLNRDRKEKIIVIINDSYKDTIATGTEVIIQIPQNKKR